MKLSLPSWRGAALLLLVPLGGCTRAPAGAPAPAPVAEKPRVESELARTTLSAVAVKSLGVRSAAVQPRSVQQRLLLPGRLMVPQNHEVTVTAPVAGYLRAPEKDVPLAGLPIEAGRALFLLEPVLSPLEQIQLATLQRGVRNELAKAEASVRVAQKELDIVTTQYQDKLRALQDVEQARARLRHATEDVDSARDKLKLFEKPAGSNGDLPPLTIKAPRGGTVLVVPVSPGQYVTATTPLMTVADLRQLWVRVPVPEADLPRLDRAGAALIVMKGGQPLSARPVALVPQVDAARYTADVIYELPSAAAGRGLLAKDQLVTVGVPLEQKREETMVPYDAVVFDAHAGAWVYVDKTAEGAITHTYERRRVELGPVEGKDVAIRPGCAKGERVVVEGAGVLFSREFYKPPQK